MSNRIKLDKQYSLVGDAHNWMLVFEEPRINQKNNEEYLFKDQWYFTTIEQVLKKYTNQVTKSSDDVEQLKDILREVNTTIKNLKYV